MPRKKFRLIPDSVYPKRASRQVRQWQGKEMGNLSRCTSPILAAALRNPDSFHYHIFKSALQCVSALVDRPLMAKYRSDIPDTLFYMERYLQTVHQTNDILFNFCTSKATRAEANRHDRDPRELMGNQCGNEARHNTAAKRGWQVDQERLQRANQFADSIPCENHLNLIKMHYQSNLASHIRHLGSVSMYSTEMGELAYKE